MGGLIDLTSPVGGLVAAVGSAFAGLPVVIVSAGALIQLSSSLPVVSSALQTGSLKPLSDVVLGQSQKDHCPFLGTETSAEPVERNVSGVPLKSVPRLSRLNAIDLSVTGAADSDVVQATLSRCQAPSVTGTVMDRRSSEGCDVDRAGPRREIVPIPGAVCSAEEAARVGSSYLCSVCQKTFSSAPQLAVHHNIHYLAQPFRCGVCRSSFASRASLEHHRSRKHHHREPESATGADPRPYKCDECGVAFRIQGHLDKHKRSKVHAARLENSQDLPGVEDTESTGGSPVTGSDAEVAAAAHEHHAGCVTANDHRQANAGTIHLWSPYVIGQTIYIFMLWFVLLSFFSSPNLSRRRLDGCHTSTHGVALVRI